MSLQKDYSYQDKKGLTKNKYQTTNVENDDKGAKMKQVYDTLYDCLEVLNTSNSEKKIEILDLINNSIVKLEDIIHSNTKSLELPTFCKQTKKIIKFIEQRLLSLENEAEFNCLGNLSKENLQSERAIVKEKIDDCISRIIEVENEISLSFRAEFQESDSTGSSNSDEYDASDLSAINEFTKRYLQEKELDDILSLKTEEQVEFNTSTSLRDLNSLLK